MKNTLSQLLFLALAFFIISASSCEKEKEPDLVPITTTGANTMGFYVDGVPHNKKGQSTWSDVYGVRGGVSEEDVLHIYGGGGNPKVTIVIDLHIDINNPLQEYDLNGSDWDKNRITIIDDSPLGGKEYRCDSIHNGKLTLLRLEQNMAAGTFYFDAINPETGKVIHVTDGRFDIQFF
ncbi:MAG: hypothetical protein J5I59_12710 [Saprospiraceae bacterium]|nr:hypothetical protein [Saprospiraceae bacterium]